MRRDEEFMEEGIWEGLKGEEIGEVGMGGMMVVDEQIVRGADNLREREEGSIGDGELVAIDEGCKRSGRWGLEDGVVYVRVEGCGMCGGGIVVCRVKKVIFGG